MSQAEYHLFIDGTWRVGAGGSGTPIVNPATEETIGAVAAAGPADIDAALQAATRALALWRDTTPGKRAEVLRRAADRLEQSRGAAAAALTREQGKTLRESDAELARAIATLRWHADAAAEVVRPRREAAGGVSIAPEPIGVVAAFVPWNYPAVIAARKLAGALSAGCSVILKGADEAPGATMHIVRALQEAGLPDGVVNLLHGDAPAISDRLLDADAVRAFTFTGSTAVGKLLARRAAATLKRCVLELGGHSPVLVFADADLEACVGAIAAYKFECAGQSCNAPSRVYVEQPAYAAFLERMTAIARDLKVGDGMDPATEMGPMANSRRLAAMQRLTGDALAAGARALTGGARIRARGYFWPPTVLANVPPVAAVMTEEPFGPLLAVQSFSGFDAAIASANANPYGLASYVFTGSNELAKKAAAALEAGSIGVNELRGVAPDVAIGGIKDSGYGFEGGRAGIEAFLNLKVVRGLSSR